MELTITVVTVICVLACLHVRTYAKDILGILPAIPYFLPIALRFLPMCNRVQEVGDSRPDYVV